MMNTTKQYVSVYILNDFLSKINLDFDKICIFKQATLYEL